jgi:hypothetical protein
VRSVIRARRLRSRYFPEELFADPHDGRRVFVELAPDTSNALRRYFAEVGQVAVV